jgi:hypothetical protein
MRRGPEGRRLNVSPARKGWVLGEDDPACPGVPWERRRCGTRPRCYNLISAYPVAAQPCPMKSTQQNRPIR